MKLPAWFPSGGLLAQEVHLAFGLMFVFGARAFGYPAWWGAATILVVDFVKEATFDQWVEGEPLVWDGMIDWAFYWVGVLVALGILFFAHRM